jgi:act minimal PKS acyl carrier protein
MTKLTIDSLRRLLVECAGEDGNVRIDEDVLDVDFADLGYDSLAMMETAARIKQEYGLSVQDDLLAEANTPRALLRVVNDDAADTVRVG